MASRIKSRYFFPLIAALCALALALQACGSSTTSSSNNGPVTITVAYEQFGPPPYAEQNWWQKVKQRVEATTPNIKVKLEPIVASEGSYYTKVDLMLRSANTAPDLVREDSFLIDSDATAGYLAPLDSYLNSWPEYQQQWYPSMQNITKFNGHNYGIMDGTDVRLIYYNKNLFAKAGLPTNWQPMSWSDILSAARTIKAKLPGVVPINLYAGLPMSELASMQGFEMLLYGTKDPLYNYTTKKWIVSSKGFEDALSFTKEVYNPANLLGPTNDVTLNSQALNIVMGQLLPQNKLAIDIDGSWVPGVWAAGGPAPWPQWQQTMGLAKMPTEFNESPHYVTLSGGWSYAMSALSQHKAQAFEVLKTAMSKDLLAGYDVEFAQIAPRKDIADVPAYRNLPGNDFFSSLVSFTQFRPAFPAYPKVSVQIESASQNVMKGQSPADAMANYAQAVKGIVGPENTETRP